MRTVSSMLHGSARTIHLLVAISGQFLVTVVARPPPTFSIFQSFSSSYLKGAKMESRVGGARHLR